MGNLKHPKRTSRPNQCGPLVVVFEKHRRLLFDFMLSKLQPFSVTLGKRQEAVAQLASKVAYLARTWHHIFPFLDLGKKGEFLFSVIILRREPGNPPKKQPTWFYCVAFSIFFSLNQRSRSEKQEASKTFDWPLLFDIKLFKKGYSKLWRTRNISMFLTSLEFQQDGVAANPSAAVVSKLASVQ